MAKTKYIDTTKCTGCRGCMVSCKNWNELPAESTGFTGTYQSHPELTANTWCLIKYKEQEVNGKMQWHFMKDACKHCVDAACVKACPQDALYHNEWGAVQRDWDKCVGCGYCVTHCPFGVIQIQEFTADGQVLVNDTDNPRFVEEGCQKAIRKSQYSGKVVTKSTKCNHCESRVNAGKKPACVSACPSGVLDFGEREDMLAKAEARLAAVREKYPNANIYNPESIEGTNAIYVLAETPSYYDLPEKPVVPVSLALWKDIVQPFGKLAMGGALGMAAVSLFLTTRAQKKHQAEHGHDDEKGADV